MIKRIKEELKIYINGFSFAFIKRDILFLFLFVFTIFLFLILFFVPTFEKITYPQVFVVKEGESIRSVAERLQDEGFVNSATLFIVSNQILGGKILFGSYHFSMPRGVFQRARELYFGDKNIPTKRIRIPERSNLYEIGDIFEKNFDGFDRNTFIELSIKDHGYLYPDTYIFPEVEVTPEYILAIMKNTFEKRVRDLFDSYDGPLSDKEILSLASIVELEASDKETREIIAGVLFNRLERNIPLQVDVSFLFINGKNSFNLTRNDLYKDDPSNTYRNRGIPPIPIANPSRESIYAVMRPAEHNYIYFLADLNGVTYFSETYDQHLSKKYKYIDSVRK